MENIAFEKRIPEGMKKAAKELASKLADGNKLYICRPQDVPGALKFKVIDSSSQNIPDSPLYKGCEHTGRNIYLFKKSVKRRKAPKTTTSSTDQKEEKQE